MSNAVLLIIENKHGETTLFAPDLRKKGFEVHTAVNGSDAVTRLEQLAPDLVIVNAASLRSSGIRICQALKEKSQNLPLILILQPDKHVDKDTADAVLNLPFTAQKLTNRIKVLLPSDGKNILHAGPIRLDQEHHRVRCLGKVAKLTPRLTALLTKLIEHQGEVIERKTLFREVWDTDYTGDTRTLDVHISWLRRALEIDPNHPRFLKTVRGVGYRLDV